MITTEQKYAFDNQGILVVDNFLDEEAAQSLSSLFCNADDFGWIDQRREAHYKTVIKNDSPELPDENEIYTAQFHKSDSLATTSELQQFMLKIKSAANVLAEADIKYYTQPLCYKMLAGDHLRVHRDLYAGEFGFTYYLSKRWKWDWGGIAHYYLPNDDEMKPILPKYNRAVFRNESIELEHYVSRVTDFALEARNSINGWGSTSDLSTQNNGRVVGNYEL